MVDFDKICAKVLTNGNQCDIMLTMRDTKLCFQIKNFLHAKKEKIMKKLNKKGFTIVELVIVIAVIAILAGVMIPTFSGIIERANQSAVKQKAAAAYKEAYAIDYSDGKLDYLENGAAVDVSESLEDGASFVYAEGNIVYTDADYSVTYNATTGEWTVAAAVAEESSSDT